MRKIEEFKETQKLMDEFKKIENKVPEINNKINDINTRTNITIEKLEDEMNLSWEDVEFNLNRNSVTKEYQKRIEEVKKEQKEKIDLLNKEKEESENERKEFFSDDKAKTITMEIKEMENEISVGKLEIKKKEIEIQQKDIELQEFYNEKEHEDPLRWQDIYNEQDRLKAEIKEIKENINGFEKKIEEYSEFKQKIFDLKYPKINIEMDEKLDEKLQEKHVDEQQENLEDEVQEEFADEQQENLEDKIQEKPADEQQKKPEGKVQEKPADEQQKKPEGKSQEKPVDKPQSKSQSRLEATGIADLKDVKIIISKEGLTVKAPGLNKEDGVDEILLNLKDLKEEVSDWKNFYNVEEFFGRTLTDEQIGRIDPNILTALSVLENSDVSLETSIEARTRYIESIIAEGEVSEDKSLKKVIEYDKTDLEYLKPKNLFSRIIHKNQFKEMREYADIAEEMGIAEVKQDKPGWIRNLVSNMKNKVKLLAPSKKLEKTEEYKNADETGKDLLSAMEEHRQLKEDRAVASNSIRENNGKIENVYYDENTSGEIKKIKTLRSSLYNESAAKESNKKHSEHAVVSDGDVLENAKDREDD